MMNPCVVDNDIKEHTTFDLDEALRFINESEEEWLKYPVNIFRAVRRGIDLNVPSLYNPDTVINVETREQACPGIFQACSEQLQASKAAKYLRELDKKHVSGYSFLTREDGESDHDFSKRLFQHACHGASYSIYIRDFPPAENFADLLDDKCISIFHPARRNPTVPGVNTSLWYYGGPGSGTYFHTEDGDYPSANLNVFGMKYWSGARSCEWGKVQEHFEKQTGQPGCSMLHRPGGYYVAPSLLDKLGVHMTYFGQNVGDLVLLGPGFVHSVQHARLAATIAVNVVPKCIDTLPEPNKCDHHTHNQRRFRSDFVVGRLRPEVVPRTPSGEVAAPMTPAEPRATGYVKKINKACDDCGMAFNKLDHYRRHMAVVHGINTLKCDICGQTFACASTMRTHKNRVHGDGLEPRVCGIAGCDKKIQVGNQARHRLNVHGIEHP
ncbi:hypothetical protein QAD02_021155 [Eretmocerus hayati]|uniref:Uncharacterized protein n=1 Tax=Eretmocerus hayati TaxID=131215 RepID=A0ACC2PSL9_9HYME|nr:hypothetical protein QAD02_021155 [Eretmocerus hayati]